MGYYGYPNYWGGVGLWGEGLYPYAMDPASAASASTVKSATASWKPSCAPTANATATTTRTCAAAMR